MEATQHKCLEFGGFALDLTRGALFRAGTEIRLRPKSFEVLRFLAENADRLVTRDEIFAAVWGDTIVTDDSLTQCLIDIRRALGDESHEIVRTVPRRGYVFDLPVVVTGDTREDDAASPAWRRPDRWMAAGAIVVLTALAAWWGVTRLAGGRAAEDAPAPGNTIAVLAFSDLSEGGDQQYFADGVAEEILNLLSRAPELRVVARTSSFSFRGSDADVATIGKALDVAYLLEGSVRRAGNRVRVTAQLVDAASGAHVWSENHDRELGDLFTVQTDIARRVARSLEITLAEAGDTRGHRASIDPQAHDHLLQGQFLHNRRAPGDLALAEEHFRKAIAIDPDYAAAWAGLAGAQLIRGYEEGAEPAIDLEAAGASALRAVELDPTLAEAHLRAGNVLAMRGDFERAQEHYDRARTLDPNNALLLAISAGGALSRGDYEDAIDLGRRAAALDPLNAINRGNLAAALASGGHCDEALPETRRARELSPRRMAGDPLEAQCLGLLGRHEEALKAAERLPDGARRDQALALAYLGLGRETEAQDAMARVIASDDRQRSLLLAELHAQRDELEQAFALLPAIRRETDAAAMTPGSKGDLTVLFDSALLRPLHADPRWAPLLAEARARSIRR